MELELKNLSDGSYNLKDSLYFMGTVDIQYNEDNKLSFPRIIIDKKSALEIMTTLLDSMNRLDKNIEKLIYEMEDDVNASKKKLKVGYK